MVDVKDLNLHMSSGDISTIYAMQLASTTYVYIYLSFSKCKKFLNEN